MRCSIIIPTRDRAALLPLCLNAVSRQRFPDYEVIVVDDGSAGGALAGARREFPAVRWFRQERRGQAAARNRGMAEATGELFVFTDVDCLPPPDWLGRHAGLYADPRLGAAGGPLVTRSRNFCDRFYHARYRDEYEQPARITDVSRWQRLVSGNLSLPRRVVERVGPFDETFRSGSDADQVRRIVRAGYVVARDPALAVEHRKGRTLGSFLVERFCKSSGALMTDVKEGTLGPRRFVPVIDPRATARDWQSYRSLYGGGAAACLGFWSLALLLRWVEVNGRAYYYWKIGRAYRNDRAEGQKESSPRLA
jgi:glycosyltransferase involved in cell wall biosynthesis